MLVSFAVVLGVAALVGSIVEVVLVHSHMAAYGGQLVAVFFCVPAAAAPLLPGVAGLLWSTKSHLTAIVAAVAWGVGTIIVLVAIASRLGGAVDATASARHASQKSEAAMTSLTSQAKVAVDEAKNARDFAFEQVTVECAGKGQHGAQCKNRKAALAAAEEALTTAREKLTETTLAATTASAPKGDPVISRIAAASGVRIELFETWQPFALGVASYGFTSLLWFIASSLLVARKKQGTPQKPANASEILLPQPTRCIDDETLAQFLLDATEPRPSGTTRLAALYSAYCTWARTNRTQPVSQREFFDAVNAVVARAATASVGLAMTRAQTVRGIALKAA